GENKSNQASGLFVSSHGRYVWSDKPFSFAFKDGQLTADGPGTFAQGQAPDRTLRGAYRIAQRDLFPPSGKMPDTLLFTAPQWNTWIELTYNQNQADILKYADSLLAHGFPPCVLMIDDTWQADYGVWRFEPRRFPDPKAMCDMLHKKGFKIMLWICPFVSADTPEYREIADGKGGFLMDATRPGRTALFRWWNGYSACLDFSHPNGHAWFKAQLDRLQRDFGVDGFKFDAGDATLYATETFTAHDPAAAAPEEQSRLFGAIGLSSPLNEYRAMWQMGGQPLAERLCDKDHSWNAIHQCASDIVIQGLLGYPFACPDMVGGGSWAAFLPGAKFEKKLVVRSAQTAALMPMIQFSLNPWRVMTAPGDEKYLDAITKVVAIRQARVPQILALAENAAKTGDPRVAITFAVTVP
ncbi:MAG TPA: glycoside hydrolase family 31 protein, partial [Opitutales bacterium]|nr:glycoside hydrolase family 31 protein [Opitutales bacterium]